MLRGIPMILSYWPLVPTMEEFASSTAWLPRWAWHVDVIMTSRCKPKQKEVRMWKLDGEIERILWNHLKPDHLLVNIATT